VSVAVIIPGSGFRYPPMTPTHPGELGVLFLLLLSAMQLTRVTHPGHFTVPTAALSITLPTTLLLVVVQLDAAATAVVDLWTVEIAASVIIVGLTSTNSLGLGAGLLRNERLLQWWLPLCPSSFLRREVA
jgi:hypothetical protein